MSVTINKRIAYQSGQRLIVPVYGLTGDGGQW